VLTKLPSGGHTAVTRDLVAEDANKSNMSGNLLRRDQLTMSHFDNFNDEFKKK
jgi:hypothetical protein